MDKQEEGEMPKIKNITWNYGFVHTSIIRGPEALHLIRLEDGRGLLRTTWEMKKLGFL
jgi:hypothetical protein